MSTEKTESHQALLGDDQREASGKVDSQDATDTELHIGEIEHGVYFSVIVAAFGGVTQDVFHESRLKIHPLIMLILSSALFVTQLSIIVLLRLDQDLETPVYEKSHAVGNPWLQMIGREKPPELSDSHLDLSSLTGVTLLKAKVLMVVVLQLIFFSKLQNCVRFLVFLLNPTTWTDVERADKSQVNLEICGKSLGFMYNAWILAPITWFACSMRLLVTYNVLVDSMSIILACSGVKQAIFNSLAVSFIGELNTFFFYFVAKVFHINDFNNFQFRKASDKLKDKLAESTIWHRVEEAVGIDTNFCGFTLRCLHRGSGANRLEWCLVGFCMFFVYFRQFGVMMDALHENVLPMSRDVCTFYHWQLGHGGNGFDHVASKVFKAAEHILVIDPAAPIKLRGDKFCSDAHKYNRRYDIVTTTASLMHEYPRLWATCLTLTAVCLVVPQVFYALNSQIRSLFLHKSGQAEPLASERSESEPLVSP